MAVLTLSCEERANECLIPEWYRPDKIMRHAWAFFFNVHVQRDASLLEIGQQQTGSRLERPEDREYAVGVVTS